jgi:hypothetical protein
MEGRGLPANLEQWLRERRLRSQRKTGSIAQAKARQKLLEIRERDEGRTDSEQEDS